MANSERFDVLVIGAGPAGIAAACAATASAKVAVVDDNPSPGGQIWRGGKPPVGDGKAAYWLREFQKRKIERLYGTQIVAAPKPGLLVGECNGEPVDLQYGKLVLATGARERFLPFPGWTLPNVIGVGGLQALLSAGLPVRGRRIAVAGSGPLLLSVAAHAQQLGASISFVAEQAPWRCVAGFAAELLSLGSGKLWQGMWYRWLLRKSSYFTGCWPTAAHGTARIEAVTMQRGGRTWTEPCDILACGFGLVPNLELPQLLGCEMRDRAVVVDDFQQSSLPTVYCAGEITGIGGVEQALVQGDIAGYAAIGARELALLSCARHRRVKLFAKAINRAFQLRSELRNLPDADTFVCRCEDVAYKRLQGLTSWRAAKLQTRCGMGPCQGRICGAAAEFLFGWKNESVRPPILPVSVETLAHATAERQE